MNKPKISLVIPTWNRLELTKICLNSIPLSNSNEVIIIDNGSKDGTGDWVKNNFPSFKLIQNHKNLGVTKAWNQGLETASANLVCIANNDLSFFESCLESMSNIMNDHPWVGSVSPYTHQSAKKPVPFFMEPAVPWGKKNFYQNKLQHRIGFTGWCFMFRKTELPEGFDPRFFLWYQEKDFLYQQIFHNRGCPPFRFPALGKVPIIVSGAEVKHQYQASHNQLNEKWVKNTTEKENAYFNRKWRGYLGNKYIKDIPWGQKVNLIEAKASKVFEFNHVKNSYTEPLVSTIIPCYNRIELFLKTLKTAIAQTYTNQEIIIVDDSSEENLEPYLSAEMDGNSVRWTMLRLERNSGPGIARKKGMEIAQGKYLQFLDSDDEIHPKKLAKQVKTMEKSPELIMTYSTTICGSNKNNLSILGYSDKEKNSIFPMFPYRVYCITSSNLWRRSLIDSHYFEALYGPEDILFEFRAGLMNRSIQHTHSSEPLVTKWNHPGNISANIATDYLYQMEILKSYDFMLSDAETYNRNDLTVALGEMYEEKIMFYLVHRRYNEAFYCMETSKRRTINKIPVDIKIFIFIYKLTGFYYLFGLLRRWRWLLKILNITKNRFKISNFKIYSKVLKNIQFTFRFF